MSARRQKAWSPHPTPRGQVDQGRAARKAQVEAALAETELSSASVRIASAAHILHGIIPLKPFDAVWAAVMSMHFPNHPLPDGELRFSVLSITSAETARSYIRHAMPKAPKLPSQKWFMTCHMASDFTIKARIGFVDAQLREAMAWACANVSPIQMLHLAASWPHSDWLPVSGEIPS